MNLSNTRLGMVSICIIGIQAISFLLIFLTGISCSKKQPDSPHTIGQKTDLKENQVKKKHDEPDENKIGVHGNEQTKHVHNDEQEGGKEFGPGKGVIEYEADRGIVLDPLAFKRLQVALTPVSSLQRKGTHWVVPQSALIEDENDKGVYIKSGKWLQFVPVKLISKKTMTAEVSGPFLKAEAIVTQSAALVRLAELNAAGASGEGHGH